MSLKIRSLVTLFVFVSHLAHGQDIYLAVKGGPHLSNLRSDVSSSADASSYLGWNLALVASYQQRNLPIGVSLEAGYIRKGAVFNVDSLDYTFEFFGGPILFDYYLTEKVKLSAGPEFAYLTGAQNQLNDSTEIDITSIYSNRFEVGGTVGASFSLTFFLDVGLRYNMAFAKIADFDPRTRKIDVTTDYLQFFLLFKIAN